MRLRSTLAAAAALAMVATGCGGDDDGGGGAEATNGEVTIEAGDIYYDPETVSVPAGEVTFTLDNIGEVEHDLIIEEAGDELVVHTEPGETASGSITLEAGTYTFYCSVPGHRATMEGSLEVE